MRRGAIIAVGALGALAACGGGQPSSPTEKAAEYCHVESHVGDDGSVSFDTKGEEDARGDNIEAVSCFLSATDMPDSLFERLDHTRALDGTQSASWDRFEVTWSYHPDSGLFLVVVPS